MNPIADLMLKDLILVVEDDPGSLGMLNDVLHSNGYTVLAATNGERALEVLDEVTPSAVLMDALLPGADGFETTRRIKDRPGCSELPVIFMTGLSETDDIVKGLEAGGVDYVVKPIDPAELVARLRVHLHNARDTQSANQALDASGQYLLSVDEEGQLVWCTPRARDLVFGIDNAAIDDTLPPQWPTPRLPEDALTWLLAASQGTPDVEYLRTDHVILQGDQVVRLSYLGPGGRGIHLLRVQQGEADDFRPVLRDRFQLTEREATTLVWVINGKSNKEIARILEISPRTVNKHLDHVFIKLGVENRTAAAIVAVRCIFGVNATITT